MPKTEPDMEALLKRLERDVIPRAPKQTKSATLNPTDQVMAALREVRDQPYRLAFIPKKTLHLLVNLPKEKIDQIVEALFREGKIETRTDAELMIALKEP